MTHQDDAICPDCGRPVSTHEMFNPPMCPVVRLHFDPDLVREGWELLNREPKDAADDR